jgi:serine/threonine protein kinase
MACIELYAELGALTIRRRCRGADGWQTQLFVDTTTERRILDGRWALTEAVGGGGMSQVYRAIDLEQEHGEVAVKVLPAPRQQDRWAVKAFDLEFKARAAPLDHPNIVPLLYRGRDAETGDPYLVFPWAGTPLTEILAETGQMPWSDWWPTYGRPLLDALAHAHRQDVAHRDVKPDNVLVADDGQPMLADFGVAKLMRQATLGLTMSEHVSRPFAPPERDVGVHSRTRDLHAWAAVTCFAVSGREPGEALTAEDPYAVLDAAAVAARPLLPPVVADAIARCLDEPQRRPAAASQLLAELDDACGTATPPEIRPDGRVQVRVPPAIERQLEEQHDLLSADLRDMLQRTISDAVILPHGQRAGEYRIVGYELSLRVSATPDGRALQVISAISPDPDQADRDRERGWPATVALTLDPVHDAEEAAEALSVLRHEVAAHRDAAQRKRRDAERIRPIMKWRAALSALRQQQASLADPVAYADVRRSSKQRNMVFTTCDPAPQRMIGQQRAAPAEQGTNFAGEVVSVSGDQVAIRPSDNASRDPLTSGELTVDTRAALSALQRQDIALDDVRYGRTHRPNLLELLADPSTAGQAHSVREPVLRQDLDDDKRAALGTALGEPDLMVVQGPPGTGKTRLIAELIVQHLHRQPDSRVLVASQTHAGLDNALQRIRVLDPSLKLLRLARPEEERVAEDVDDLRLDAQLEAWREEAIRSGRAWLARWAADAGVSPPDIRAAMDLDALAAELEHAGRLRGVIDQLTARLRELGGTPTAPAAASATADTARAISDELLTQRSELRAVEARARELVNSLAEEGQLTRGARLRQLDPDDLRQRSAGLAPATQEGQRCREFIELLAQWHARFGETSEFAAAALARAQVVGATCVGLGAMRGVRVVPFDLCIIDEASRATAPELLIPIARASRYVLVGDDRQLPPYLDTDALSDTALEPFGLTRADFEQPFFSYLAERLPEGNVVALKLQHRMHPAIGRLVSDCFYDGDLRSAREDIGLPDELQAVAPAPVTWITTARMANRRESRRGESIFNDAEAAVIVRLVQQLADATARRKNRLSVAVLTPYRAQRKVIADRLAAQPQRSKTLHVAVHTVDSFQGQEADIAIYSATRSNAQGRLGFTRERPRLNVALSRGRELLIIVGDHVTARRGRGDNPLRDVIEHVEAHHGECELVEDQS